MRRSLGNLVLFVVFAALFSVLAWSGPLHAQTSGTTMDFQGYLTDENGDPITDSAASMTFSIWDAASSGNKLWEEVHDGDMGNAGTVNVASGVFQATLGTVNPLDDRDDNGEPVFTGANRWLQIEVWKDPTYQPMNARVQLVADAHALAVTRSVNITQPSGATDSPVVVNTDDFVVTSAGKVGIGTTPTNPLHVQRPGDGVAARFQRDGGGIVDVETYASITGIGTASNIPFRLNTNNTERVRVDATGNVGIGTTSPAYALDVQVSGDGGIRTTTTGTNNAARLTLESGDGTTSGKYAYVTAKSREGTPQEWRWGMYGTKKWHLRDESASAYRLTVDMAGNVGIGETSPGSLLHVRDIDMDNNDGYAATIENAATGAGDHALKLQLGTTSASAGADFIAFYGGTTALGAIEINESGALSFDAGGTAGDFAEYFQKLDSAEDLRPGQIVYMVGNRVTGESGVSWHALGVVSDRAAFIASKPFGRVTEVELEAIRRDVVATLDEPNSHPTRFADETDADWNRRNEGWERDRDAAIHSECMRRCEGLIRERTQANLSRHCLVALLGRVPVNIQGHANAGDYILYDGTAINPDRITFKQYRACVGKALESGEGQVLCLVGVR